MSDIAIVGIGEAPAALMPEPTHEQLKSYGSRLDDDGFMA